MTIFWFSSILSTKRPWRSSTRTRSVRQHSNGADAVHRALWFFTSTVSLSCPKGGRHSTTHGEGSSRWALVLPPNTVKIRGGRSIFLRHSQACVLPSHAVKTGRGCSTRYQAHVLPPYAVKTRGGRSAFRQAYVLPSHAIKTGRGRSTFHHLRQAHVLPPNTVKIRGGRPTHHYH